MEETIKPPKVLRKRGIFDDLRKAAEIASMPSPPQSTKLPSTATFDSAPMPIAATLDLASIDASLVADQLAQSSSSYATPMPKLAYQSVSEMGQLPPFQDPFAPANLESNSSQAPTSHSPAFSAHRRSESISSMNLEEAITETGITVDDIANFISGPDHDGKWLCLYPECSKKFGRKENIKSHVQTHLGDRQYQCPHCKKCFVRQHDLKRHAKIHSGIKPYPCQCGNSFARHDALTRHRQRGMCIGAFEGIVKKTVKRGRPRKARPDGDERASKSAKTRAKNKTMSSSSSAGSGYASSASAHSPRSEVDDILDETPLGDFGYSQMSSASSAPTDQGTYAYAQDHTAGSLFSSEGAVSLTASASVIPSAYSQYPSDQLSSHPSSPAKSMHSQYHSPPSLVESASSPAAKTLYDFDGHEGLDGLGNLAALVDLSGDDEAYLRPFMSLSHLERDPSLLLSKFDEFLPGDEHELFKDSDIFFGNA